MIEGAATLAGGLAGFYFITTSPRHASWLRDDEKRYLILRQKYPHGPVRIEEKFEWKYVWQACTDWKVWTIASTVGRLLRRLIIEVGL